MYLSLKSDAKLLNLHGPRTLLSNLYCNTALVLQLEHWFDEFICEVSLAWLDQFEYSPLIQLLLCIVNDARKMIVTPMY